MDLLDAEMRRSAQRLRKGALPVRSKPIGDEKILMHHIEGIYGYRGADARVYFLNPWEFEMFWEVERVGSPKQPTKDGKVLSVWTGVEVLPGTEAEAGKHYVIDDVGLREHDDYIVLPDIPAMQQMRHEWVLRRANRPYVPQPDSTLHPWKTRPSATACIYVLGS